MRERYSYESDGVSFTITVERGYGTWFCLACGEQGNTNHEGPDAEREAQRRAAGHALSCSRRPKLNEK